MDSLLVNRGIDADQNVASRAGPHLIGYFLNWGLFGVLTVQVYLYYLAFPKDKWPIKVLVYFLYALDMIQSIIITNDAFIKYGVNFSNVDGLSAMQNAWLSIPLISAINATAVQLFFAYRITIFTESKLIFGIIASLALVGGAAGIAEAVQAKIVNNLAIIAVETRTTLTVWLTITAAGDVIIAAFMTYFLSRKRSGFNNATDDAITKIIQLVVETGSITAILAVVTVILFFVFPTHSYWNVPIDILGKFYSNNLLVIFNRRITIVGGRNTRTEEYPESITTSCQIGLDRTRPHSRLHGAINMPSIHTHREVWAETYKIDHAQDPPEQP